MSLTTQPSFNNTHISIPLGIFIGLLASFVQSLGLTIQRKSHVINQSLPRHRQRVEHRRPLWLLGFTIFILSNLVGSLVQIASLPVVILAPLGAVSLLWNAFFARLILGDIFSPWMITGTILIAGGAVLIAVFGIVPEPTHSLEDLLELFRRPTFVVYFSLLGMVVFVCLALTHVGEFSWSRRVSKVLECDYSSSPSCTTHNTDHVIDVPTLSNTYSTLSDATINEATPLLGRKRDRSQSSSSLPCNIEHPSPDSVDRTSVLLAISYASVSGIISGMCLIFAKSGVELLLLTIRGENQFRRWESWVLVSGLIIFALLQMWYLHKALILANPTLVCPSAFCFYNISSIVNGLVYFNQIELITAFHLLLVALGIIILLGGVWVVSIQSGGGGVDVGTWNQETQDTTDEDAGIDIEQVEVEGGRLRESTFCRSDSDTTIRSTSRLNPHFGPVPIEGHTRSEPLQAISPLSSSTPEIGASSTLMIPHHRHTTFSTTDQLSPPSFRTRFTQRRPTTGGDIQRSSHQRNSSHPSVAFSPPLNGTVSTLGTGLQIGLSPISPGFVIVPRERRRKLSGLGLGDAEQDSRPRQRSVSEGDVGGALRIYGNSDFPDSNLTNERQIDEGDAGGPSRGRMRWKWLKNIFVQHK
ncbi:hypothetical protein P691DRAFT_558189 [Macrolepiota fuliginosa MF-IS2]|uniref:Uncharacterized protein n=1 Tax=Macrolepiota fuliginosa MF-IS2 TaxID=1400762 RepID=A0A9P5XLP7_9AGAR|nr:hypothetical protein P691DRAFT_558189 [Macrolepiota fuliginosa MF-IS2]